VPDAAYYREYRRRRKAEGNPIQRDRPSRAVVPAVTFTDAVMILVASQSSEAALARAAFIEQKTLNKWMNGHSRPNADQMDALVDYFGLDHIRAIRAEARRILRSDPVSRLTPVIPGPFLPRERRARGKHPWR
jgi:transcriptional regulator with XRE-family HTH domain